MSSTEGQIESTIRNKLHTNLEATHLEIINESHLHGGPPGSETHFKVIIVSKKFEDLPSLKRHKLVNDTLRDEIRTNIRGLAIVAQSPQQWASGEESVQMAAISRPNYGTSNNRTRNVEIARWP